APGETLAIAQVHDVERLLRRQHRTMAAARMVGMSMGDDGPCHRSDGIDVEAARLAPESGGGGGPDVFRSPFCHIGSQLSSYYLRVFENARAPVPVLRRSDRRPSLRIRARPAIEGRSCCRRRHT